MDTNGKNIAILIAGGLMFFAVLGLFIITFASGEILADNGAEEVESSLNSYTNSTYSSYDNEEFYGSQIRQFIDSALGKQSVILINTYDMSSDDIISNNNDRYIQIYNGKPYVNHCVIISASDNNSVDAAIQIKAGETVGDLDDTMTNVDGYLKSSGVVCTENRKYISDNTIGDFGKENTIEYVDKTDLFISNILTDCNGIHVGVVFTQIEKE